MNTFSLGVWCYFLFSNELLFFKVVKNFLEIDLNFSLSTDYDLQSHFIAIRSVKSEKLVVRVSIIDGKV